MRRSMDLLFVVIRAGTEDQGQVLREALQRRSGFVFASKKSKM